MLELARLAERKAGYWLVGQNGADSLRSLIFHETTASRSISYESQLVPGLLQTPRYARSQIEGQPGLTPAEVAAAIRTRMERQQILRWAEPAQFTFFVHEQALRLRVDSCAIMVEQLLHLVLLAALEHVTLRVVPAAAGERSAFGGSFRLFEYEKHRSLVYLDHVRGGGLFVEEPQYVEDYRRLLPALTKIALDEGQSRSFVANLADEYDRGSPSDVARHLEEEQLQRPSYE